MDKKLNWKNDIENLDLESAKILYMIYYLFIQKLIDDNEKKKLKMLTLVEDPRVIKVYKAFEVSGAIGDLVNGLKALYNEEMQGTVSKHYSKSIIHKAFESTMKNGPPTDEEMHTYNMRDKGGEHGDRKKKKYSLKEKHRKESKSKTFISKAIGKMKNNSESED